MAEQTISIKVVLDKITRHPLLADIPLETLVDYTVDFLRIVGVPRMFTDRVALIEVNKYRGKLPCDWIETIQVRDTKTCECLRYATDTFHISNNKRKPYGNTFTIQNNIIYTSVEDTIIEIAYRAIEVDENMFPLIPDNSSLTRAIECYVKVQWFTILFDLGKVSGQSLQVAQQEYAWAVGACETEFSRLDLSKAESLFNSFRSLLIRPSEFNNHFTNSGSREILKRN